jgi:DNA helicase-2/ATP-dependent DNA helicase PcrA
LILAANHYKRPMIDIVNNIDKVDLKINTGTKNKLRDFSEMIKAFGIESIKMNAFEIADSIVKRVKIVKDLEADGTPEGISKVENVQELLNGIKYFIDDAKEKGQEDSLAVFLEDVALKTDLDSDKPDDEPVVSLMTIHLAKGLEYPYVYIVGMEESLFPSAMSMNTRSELEEERRLFYVALTRAEQQAYLSYANTRYRWGKLTDAEPSRFLEEIDASYLEYLTPKRLEPRTNNFVDSNLFEDDIPKDRIRYRKPVSRSKTSVRKQPSETVKKSLVKPPSNFKKVSATNTSGNLFDSKITVGNFVEHQRFGKGEVLKMEGTGGDVKAEIRFEKQGIKKLILKFSKLKVIG